jgi:hypothetical protein
MLPRIARALRGSKMARGMHAARGALARGQRHMPFALPIRACICTSSPSWTPSPMLDSISVVAVAYDHGPVHLQRGDEVPLVQKR